MDKKSHINLDPSVTKQYEGIYKSKNKKIKVTLEQNHLWISYEQIGFKAGLYPESEVEFFMLEDNIQFTFHKNKKGEVTGMSIFVDAKEINVKKIE